MAERRQPKPVEVALKAKIKLIIDMAIDFTAMTRIDERFEHQDIPEARKGLCRT
jgi:hypothetical protein